VLTFLRWPISTFPKRRNIHHSMDFGKQRDMP
jgi:hypothetical protein